MELQNTLIHFHETARKTVREIKTIASEIMFNFLLAECFCCIKSFLRKGV